MISIYKQRGATFIFWMFFVAIIGFLLMIGAKLFPVYYKGFSTEKIVEDVALEMQKKKPNKKQLWDTICLLYTSPSPRDLSTSRMPSSA